MTSDSGSRRNGAGASLHSNVPRPVDAPSGRPPRIYFARAMDGIGETQIHSLADAVARDLEAHGFALVDPFTAVPRLALMQELGDGFGDAIVKSDLALLQRSDGVLVDMSIPGRNYVGCVCEITYAFLWRIPVAVYVGKTSNGARHWLRFHADHISEHRHDAVRALQRLVPERRCGGDDRETDVGRTEVSGRIEPYFP
jgi:hypothetical protein